MSTLINHHTFVAFDSATSKASEGQRLVRILYKATRGGKAVSNPRKSACVSVPMLGEALNDSQINALLPHITLLLESAQDGICKAAYERKAVSVSSSELSVDCCIAYLDDDATGNRLTREAVAEWFNETLQDVCIVAFSDKFFGVGKEFANDSPEMLRITQTVNVYRDKISSLAGGKTQFSVANCESLLKVLELSPDDDAMATRFTRRLQKMVADQRDTLDSL